MGALPGTLASHFLHFLNWLDHSESCFKHKIVTNKIYNDWGNTQIRVKNNSKVIRHEFEQNSPTGKSMSEPKVFSRGHPRVKPRGEVAVNLQTK